MYFLDTTEEVLLQHFFDILIDTAKKATCIRSKCGSIIVKNEEIIWKWYNSPPWNQEHQRRCENNKSEYHQKVTDKTCCIHAEQRAIFDALKYFPQKIIGSRLYFIRLDDSQMPKFSWVPYCTLCSKSALDAGIDEFVLWTEQWFCVYNTQEYNDLSFEYNWE